MRLDADKFMDWIIELFVDVSESKKINKEEITKVNRKNSNEKTNF